MILSLSSTAIVIQILSEKKALSSQYGRISFATLVFQDIAVIPVLFTVGILGSSGGDSIWFQLGMALLNEGKLPEAVASASREAASAFGDPTVFCEPYVERGHHIEVQVLADAGFEAQLHLEAEPPPGDPNRAGQVWKQMPAGGEPLAVDQAVVVWVNP